jgi:hypothetical protein
MCTDNLISKKRLNPNFSAMKRREKVGNQHRKLPFFVVYEMSNYERVERIPKHAVCLLRFVSAEWICHALLLNK